MAAISGLGNIRRALAIRNYRIFAAGTALSHIGTWVQRLALGWLTWKLTHSGAWLGIISSADLFPTVVLAPITGAMADRVDRLRMMQTTQSLLLLQAAALAALTLTGAVTIEWLVGLALFGGVVTSFNQPVRLAIVPSLVDRESLSAAIAINSLMFNIARFAGPVIAGWVIDFVSVGAAFVVNAASFLFFLVALAMLRLGDTRPPKQPTPPGQIPREILEGYRYAAGHPGIGRILIVLIFVAVCARPYIDLLPGFAEAVFGRGVQELSWLLSMTGIGAMVGGTWLAQHGSIKGLTNVSINAALMFACAMIAFTATDSYWVGLIAVFFAGCGMVLTGVGEQTLIQHAVDPAMRGRVMAIYGMIGRGAPALGALIMGGFSEFVGLRGPVMGGAVLVICMWLWARSQRHIMARELEVEAEGR